jgi:hypothetical protein
MLKLVGIARAGRNIPRHATRAGLAETRLAAARVADTICPQQGAAGELADTCPLSLGQPIVITTFHALNQH